MRKVLKFVILLFIVAGCKQKHPFNDYKIEISNLKTFPEIDAYWNALYLLDQDVLMNTSNIFAQDSISISNMARTAILFETYGNEVYKPENVVPILNFTHSRNSEALLAFWPIMLECKKVGGIIESFGGNFPYYQLENISLTFYNYSLLNQEAKYPELLEALTVLETSKTVTQNLIIAFNNQKKRQKLSKIALQGEWKNQAFANKIEKGSFKFVKMSDGDLYIDSYDVIQKLILKESTKEFKLYKVEYEPFGWYYKLQNNGQLSLLNHEGETLIDYTKHI